MIEFIQNNFDAILGVSALIVSIGAVIYSFIANRNSHQLQTRIVAIEEARDADRIAQSKKAKIRGKVESNATGTSRSNNTPLTLTVKNEGEGIAHNINIQLTNPDSDALSGSLVEKTIETLDAEANTAFNFGEERVCDRTFRFSARWDDDSGEPGNFCDAIPYKA